MRQSDGDGSGRPAALVAALVAVMVGGSCTPGDEGATESETGGGSSSTTAAVDECTLNEGGALVWTSIDASPSGGAAAAHGIALAADGHLFVTGWIGGPPSTHPGVFTNDDIFTRRMTRDGAGLWTLVHDGPPSGRDAGLGIAAWGADGALVVGQWQPDAGTHGEVWIRAIGGDAAVAWTSTAHGNNYADDAGQGVTVLADGTAVVIGRMYGGAKGSDDGTIWLRRLSPEGAEMETAVVTADGDPWHAGGTAVATTPGGGGIFAAGIRPKDGFSRVWASRRTDALAKVWEATLVDAPGAAFGVASTLDGDAIVVAALGEVGILGYGEGPTMGFIGRLRGDDGGVVWTQTRAEGAKQRVNAVAVDACGDLVVVGEVGGAAPRAWFAKLRPEDGAEVWSIVEAVEAGEVSSRAYAVVVDADRSVYAAGQVTSAGGERFWVQRRGS